MNNSFIGFPTTTQTITLGSSSVAITNAVSDYVNRVRIVSTGNCHINIDGAPTAAAGDFYLPANIVEYFAIHPGQKVAAIQDDTATGTVYVTEMTQ